MHKDHLSARWLPMQITITWNLDRRGCLYFLEKAGKGVFREGREGGVPNPSSQANFCQNPSYQIFGVYNGIICIDVLDF